MGETAFVLAPIVFFLYWAFVSLLGSRSRGYKLFSCSTQLSMTFILLVNVKMSTIVGILTFISRINIPSECFKHDYLVIYQYFTFYEQSKCRAQLS